MQPVSSTELGLTSVFGMGTGISPIHIDTTICEHKMSLSYYNVLTSFYNTKVVEHNNIIYYAIRKKI